MYLTKIIVLIAQDNLMGDDRSGELANVIEAALSATLDREAIFEIRDGGTTELTLQAIDAALETGEPLGTILEPNKPIIGELDGLDVENHG